MTGYSSTASSIVQRVEGEIVGPFVGQDTVSTASSERWQYGSVGRRDTEGTSTSSWQAEGMVPVGQ